MVPDLHDSGREKRKCKIFQRLDDPPERLSKNSSSQFKKIL